MCRNNYLPLYQHCFYCGYHLVIWLHKITESANLFQLFYEWCRHIVYVIWSYMCRKNMITESANLVVCMVPTYVIWSYHVQNELIAWLSHYCANIFLEHKAYSFVDEGWNKFLGLLYDSKHINLSWQMSTKFFMPYLMEPHVIICLLGVLCVKFFAGSYIMY